MVIADAFAAAKETADVDGGEDAMAAPAMSAAAEEEASAASSLGLNSLAAAAYRSASDIVSHSVPSCAAVANRTVWRALRPVANVNCPKVNEMKLRMREAEAGASCR